MVINYSPTSSYIASYLNDGGDFLRPRPTNLPTMRYRRRKWRAGERQAADGEVWSDSESNDAVHCGNFPLSYTKVSTAKQDYSTEHDFTFIDGQMINMWFFPWHQIRQPWKADGRCATTWAILQIGWQQYRHTVLLSPLLLKDMSEISLLGSGDLIWSLSEWDYQCYLPIDVPTISVTRYLQEVCLSIIATMRILARLLHTCPRRRLVFSKFLRCYTQIDIMPEHWIRFWM